MELAVFFPLLLLVCSVSTESVTKNADYKPPHEPFPYDINAVLREMTASLAVQKVKMEQLQKDNEEQKTRQKTEVDKQKTEVDKLKQQLQGQKNEVDKLKQKLQAVSSRTNDPQGRQVAFSTGLMDKGQGNFGPFSKQENVIFKHVITNIGKAYNSHTGIFTAPLKGAYHFDFHVGAYGDSKYGAGVLLYKNEHRVIGAYEHQATLFGTASNSVTLTLETGDQVYLHMFANTRLWDSFVHHCSFSGHLLFTM